MDFFKKPLVAIILAVIFCGGILSFNTSSKLGEEVDAVEDSFFTNVDGQRSIYSRLQEKLSASNGVWTVLVKYDEAAAEELYYDRDYLIWACEGADIASMKYANDDLNDEFARALRTLELYNLTAEEQELVDEYSTAFSGAQKMIDENSYNSEVLEFMSSTYNKFPTRELAEFAGVNPPETFN